MNLKKFKKSLVSIVLGSSLFLGNGGVICQQPKAWFTDEFITTAREAYKDDQNIQLLLIVSEFLSKLSRPSTLETEFLSLKEKLLEETIVLTLPEAGMPYLRSVLEYLESLRPLLTRSGNLAELQQKLTLIANLFLKDSDYQSENTENSLIREKHYMAIVACVLLSSASQKGIENSENKVGLELSKHCVERLYQSNKELTNSAMPCRMIVLLHYLFIELRLEEIQKEIVLKPSN